MRRKKKRPLEIGELSPVVIQFRLQQIERSKTSVDYAPQPNSAYLLSESRSTSQLLLASDESEYDFYRRIRSEAVSRMSTNETSITTNSIGRQTHPSQQLPATSPRSRQQTKTAFVQKSPLNYEQEKDLSPQRKLLASQKARNRSPNQKNRQESQSPTRKGLYESPRRHNARSRRDSPSHPIEASPPLEPRQEEDTRTKTSGSPDRFNSPERRLRNGEDTQEDENAFYHDKKVKTPDFVKRHPEKFCMNGMRQGTRQQFVLIATAYNTDVTRKQIVDKYKRLMQKSTPMKQLMIKEQKEDLDKYRKWLDSDQRYVGFGSQLDLKNRGFLNVRNTRSKEEDIHDNDSSANQQ